MAYRDIDTTQNHDMGRTLSRIRGMLQDLYGALGLPTTEGGSVTQTAVAVAGAATLNTVKGSITTEALTTAAGAEYTLTLTDSAITANSQVLASVANGTNTTGVPIIRSVKPAAGSVVIVVRNIDAAAALNGTLVISFVSHT